MKLCIFGADGRTGVDVVRYAKESGFDVVAFVYAGVPESYFPKDVILKKGDVMNYQDVRLALEGVDAVISVVGHIKGSDPLMQTKGIENIVRAMKELGIRRVLSLTGTGARAEGDKPSFTDRLLNAIVTFVDPERIRDGISHVKVLQESGLDFTVVRVLKLQNKKNEVHSALLTLGGPAELFTSRKKVAKVLVDLVKDDTYIGKQPVISG